MTRENSTSGSVNQATREGCDPHQVALPTVGSGEPGPHPPHVGHYHAVELSGGDFGVIPCDKRHYSKRDGHSIKDCGKGKMLVFPAVSSSATLSEIEGIAYCFRCKSWRCEHCRPYVFRRDFARVCTALESRSRWLYVVLTFRPESWQGGKGSCWKNAWRPIQRLRQRLARAVGGKVEYVATMEQHKTGWPHANLAIRFDLLDQVDGENVDDFARAVERWIKDNAPSVGLGYRVYCDVLQGEARAAAYFSKLAGEKDTPGPSAAAGEMVKGSQVPLDAPLGTRRLRASRGILPALRKGEQGLGVAFVKGAAPGAPEPTVGGPVRGDRGAEPPPRPYLSNGPPDPAGVGLYGIEQLTAGAQSGPGLICRMDLPTPQESERRGHKVVRHHVHLREIAENEGGFSWRSG